MQPKYLVFVIDDEQVIARTLAVILQKAGYRTEFFYSAEAALDRAQQRRPDLIVSDVMLTGISGIDLVRNIHRLFPRLPHILISGEAATSSLIDEARRQGENVTVYSKPTKPLLLLERIAFLLKGVQASDAPEEQRAA